MAQRKWQESAEGDISDAERYLELADDKTGMLPAEQQCLASIACSLLAIAKSLDSIEVRYGSGFYDERT